MNDLHGSHWLAGVFFAALAASFILCVASDLGLSAMLYQAGIVLPATGGMVGLGIIWLIGHGLHGAAVFAVPIFFLARGRAMADDGGGVSG